MAIASHQLNRIAANYFLAGLSPFAKAGRLESDMTPGCERKCCRQRRTSTIDAREYPLNMHQKQSDSVWQA
jgi:hypothetical protein